MPLQLGSSAVSLYLGSQDVRGHVGSALVTLPVKPAIANAISGTPSVVQLAALIFSANSYVFYVDGDPTAFAVFGFDLSGRSFATDGNLLGSEVEVAGVNAAGEGPKSDPVVFT